MADDFDPAEFDKFKNEFDPNELTKTATPKNESTWSRAITDIPTEIGREFTGAVDDIKALGRRGEMGPVEGLMATGKAALAPVRAAFSPLVGGARSVLGHGMANAERAFGENVVNPIVEKMGGTPQHPDTEQMYEKAKGDVDLALAAARPQGVPVKVAPTVPTPRGPYEIPSGAPAWQLETPPAPAANPPPLDRLGVTLTEGEATGNLAARQREQAALRGQSGEPAQQHATEFFNEQRPQQLEQARTDVARELDPVGRQEIVSTPQQAAQLGQEQLQHEFGRSKAGVQQRYQEAKDLGGDISPDYFNDMVYTIKNDLFNRPDGSIVVNERTPRSADMMDYLNEKVAQLKLRNDVDPLNPTGLDENGHMIVHGPQGNLTRVRPAGITLEGVEEWRKTLSNLRRDASAAYNTNPTDARAAQAILDQFDQKITQAVNSGHFSGDPAAVQAWNSARAAHAEHMKLFGNDAVGRRLRTIIGDASRGVDPAALDTVADYFFSAGGTKPGEIHIGMAKRLKKIFGEDSPEWAAIRQGWYHRLVSEGERGYTAIGKRLANAIDTHGANDMAGVLFTPPQRQLLNEYAELHRTMAVPQTGANWPNTAAGIIPHIKKATGHILGAIGGLIGHMISPVVGGAAGFAMGEGAGYLLRNAENARNYRQISRQLPLVGQRLRQWQQASAVAETKSSMAAEMRRGLAANQLVMALERIGIGHDAALRLLASGPESTGPSEAKENKIRVPVYKEGRASGGVVSDNYETFLTPEQEAGFQSWKAENAPNDSGLDYDLRGAYLAGMRRDSESGHMGDRFKKPNHPTFSDESQYAIGDQRNRAGHWVGETFVPPAPFADGGVPTFDERFTGTTSDAPSADDMVDNVTARTAARDNIAPNTDWAEREAQSNIALQQQEQPWTLSGAWEGMKDAAKRFSQYDRQFTEDVLNLPRRAYEHSDDLKKGLKNLVGMGEEERYQLWPEKMVRSGASLPHDVMSGEVPQYELDPKTGEWHTSTPMVERTQDLAGMAGSGGLAAGASTDATLGSAPFLRPALKYEGKIYKAPMGGQHLDAIPKEIYPEFQRQAMSGEDISNFNFGFMNHKGHFLDREAALDYAVKEGLVDPRDANQGALTTTLLEDSSAAAPVAALAKSAEPFYSAVEQTLSAAKQQKMHGEQWANWLKNQPGVKPDELQYTGIDNWLREQKGLVTKEQVQDYLKENKVVLNDVVRGARKTFQELSPAERRGVMEDFLEYKGIDNEEPWWQLYSKSDPHLVHELERHYKGIVEETPGEHGTTKYHSYQLPGGENYREHLITLPTKLASKEAIEKAAANQYQSSMYKHLHPETEFADAPNYVRRDFINMAQEAADRESVKGNYKSSHWDEPNVLAHMRTNDREVAGKPSYHIEEIQSDWHQQGRKQGYKRDNSLPSGWQIKEVRNGPERFGSRDYYELLSPKGEQTNVHKLDEHGRQALVDIANLRENRRNVPDAPFKKDWAELALKKAIRNAVEEGKDRISWTPGEAQAARYDLSKHIDRLEYEPSSGALEGKKNGRSVLSKHSVKPEDLPDIVGKDVAEKLMQQEPTIPQYIIKETGNNHYIIANPDGYIAREFPYPYRGREQAQGALNNFAHEQAGLKVLKDQDLKVGGEGMKGFYDQMLPKMVEKLGKKYGVKVKEGHTGRPSWEQYKVELDPDQGQPYKINGKLIVDRQLLPEELAAIAMKMSGNNKYKAFRYIDDEFGDWPEVRQIEQALTQPDKNAKSVPVKYFDIPEKMKEEVLTKGFPLFSDTGHAAPMSTLAKQGRETLYHGTSKDKPFRKLKEASNGTWFTTDPEEASMYAKNNDSQGHKIVYDPKMRYERTNTASRVIPMEHSFENTKVLKEWPDSIKNASNYKRAQAEYFYKLRREGYDSVRMPTEGGHSIVVSLDNSKLEPKYSKAPPKGSLYTNTPVAPRSNEEDIDRPRRKENSGAEINVPERAAGGRVVASNINHAPTEAQKSAGNYSKDHVFVQGLDITIENAKGHTRSGIGKDGKKWSVKMPAHYGYVKQTKGADGDHVDVYLGPHIKSKNVFVINQIDADSKEFDEHKAVLGAANLRQALDIYTHGFSDGKGLNRIGSIVPTTIEYFKEWLKSPSTKKPFKLNA